MDFLIPVATLKDLFDPIVSFIDKIPGLRVILASILIFFLPGFAWSLVFFARNQVNKLERFVLSIRSECLDKIIPLGERHLRKAIKEFMAHYHAERNHQGIDSQIIQPDEYVGVAEGPVKTRSRLGALLNYYYREAA